MMNFVTICVSLVVVATEKSCWRQQKCTRNAVQSRVLQKLHTCTSCFKILLVIEWRYWLDCELQIGIFLCIITHIYVYPFDCLCVDYSLRLPWCRMSSPQEVGFVAHTSAPNGEALVLLWKADIATKVHSATFFGDVVCDKVRPRVLHFILDCVVNLFMTPQWQAFDGDHRLILSSSFSFLQHDHRLLYIM